MPTLESDNQGNVIRGGGFNFGETISTTSNLAELGSLSITGGHAWEIHCTTRPAHGVFARGLASKFIKATRIWGPTNDKFKKPNFEYSFHGFARIQFINLQSDPSGWSQPPVDIKTKFVF